jgi:tRNA pseudouridine38-40 synthase
MDIATTDPSGSVVARSATSGEDRAVVDRGAIDTIPVVEVTPPAEGRSRIRMTLAYDGSKFHGMAENRDVVTVVGTVREVIERVIGHEVEIAMAGRTDAGVHAWGQVISFDVPTDLLGPLGATGRDAGRASPANLARAINRVCVPSIVVRDARLAARDFDARFSAISRRYRYTILNRPVPDPFLAATSWWVPHDLDLGALRLGCDALYGSHDFAAFCRRPKPVDRPDHPIARPASLVRRVTDATWHDLGDGILRFEIEASSFCHQMVRSVVGTLVEMGRGRRRPGEMAGIIRTGDRAAAGGLAPPQGLCLWAVGYRGGPDEAESLSGLTGGVRP